ncbi:MAG: hypothetical protein IK048_05395 [Clostridia bacterium]|nr:hypothetical protein [Clostridia bacterium]
MKFAICLGVGVAFGVFLLLLFRKSGKAERFVTDLFATLAAGMGYIGCLELVFGGKFELYGLIAYCAGACLIPSLFLLCKRRRTKRITPAN